ncbi:MAG: hypothetical protein R2715_04630 [Ilumatobacteraceae bacterium]
MNRPPDDPTTILLTTTVQPAVPPTPPLLDSARRPAGGGRGLDRRLWWVIGASAVALVVAVIAIVIATTGGDGVSTDALDHLHGARLSSRPRHRRRPPNRRRPPSPRPPRRSTTQAPTTAVDTTVVDTTIEETTTTDVVAAAGTRVLIASDDGLIRLEADGSRTELRSGPVLAAVESGGQVYVQIQTADGVSELRTLDDTMLVQVTEGATLALHDAVTSPEGTHIVYYSVAQGTTPDDRAEWLYSFDLDTGVETQLGQIGAWESGTDGSQRGQRLVRHDVRRGVPRPVRHPGRRRRPRRRVRPPGAGGVLLGLQRLSS